MTSSQSHSPSLSILIPTYGRDQALIDTITSLLELPAPSADEIVILDQTPRHADDCEEKLSFWDHSGIIRWVRLPTPSITVAMNLGLVMASSEHVLFVDDDINPDPGLIAAHRTTASEYPKSLVAGRVLQPWHRGQADPVDSSFRFNSLQEREHDDFIGCNVSMDRQTALEIGGFDRNFVRVAYRYESEFAFRWRRSGHRIRYNPNALVHHLKIPAGGTRSYSQHLTTIRPDHSVGRYYYFWKTCTPWLAIFFSLSSFFRSVCTRHHIRKPWWIPLTLLAELRGFLWSCRLALSGSALQAKPPIRLLIVTTHPIQYQVPLFRELTLNPSLDVEVLFLTLPDAHTQGEGFGVSFEWDTPLLAGYKWRTAMSRSGRGGFSRFLDLRLRRPLAELKGPYHQLPDIVLVTGWQSLGLLQILLTSYLSGVSILLRMDNNDKRPRGFLQRLMHRLLLSKINYVLPVGAANSRYYSQCGISSSRRILSPHCVDNRYFADLADLARPARSRLRQAWGIPDGSFCFLFCGKLQEKKHPSDLLTALELLKRQNPDISPHCLIVGSGELELQLKEQASSRDLPVTFTGFLNQGDLSSAYVASDALVLPSDFDETWGLVVNEAMSCGLPAIVSDQVGCAEDLVIPGQTGYVFPSRDVKALSAAMAVLASDPLESCRMGFRASDRVNSSYSVTKAVEGVTTASYLTFCKSPH